MRTVDELIVEEEVVFVLGKDHEMHTYAIGRLVSDVVLVDGRVLDVGEFGVKGLFLELEFFSLIGELVEINGDKTVLFLIDIVEFHTL